VAVLFLLRAMPRAAASWAAAAGGIAFTSSVLRLSGLCGGSTGSDFSSVILRLSSFSVGTAEEVAESEAFEKATLLLLSASLEGCLGFLEELRKAVVLLALALSVLALSLALAGIESSVASCEVCSHVGGTSVVNDFGSV
jgi:hypothetical protein